MLLAHPHFHLAPLALAVALALAAPGTTLAQAAAGSTQAVTLSIASQPLGSALNELSAATGTPIGFSPALVTGKTGHAVKGDLTVRQAVDQLLLGNGLVAVWEGGGIVVKAAPRDDDVATLAPVTVTAQAERDGTTEGTGSYTQTGTSSTATKLGLTLRETPQSVTVVTRQKMDDKGYQTLDQAITDSPGLTASNHLGNSRYTYYSRGLSVDNIQFDGVSTPVGTYTRDADPADGLDFYDRVEILRGAAGLMSGAGNPSGTINLIRKRPLNVPKTRIEASVSSFGNGKLLLDTSQPLNAAGTVRGRFVGSFTGGDSYTDYSSSKEGALYGVIDADIGSRTTVSLAYSYKHEKINGYDWTGLVARPDGSFFDFDASTYLGSDSDYAKRRQHTAYLDIEHRFDNDWSLKSSGRIARSDSYMETESRYYSNNSYWKRDASFDYKNVVYAFEMNLSGPINLFGRSHDAVIGFNKSHSDLTVITGRPYPDVRYSFDPENWDPTTYLPANKTPNSDLNSINNQYGFYGQTRFNISNYLKILAGGRLSWYRNTDVSETISSGQIGTTKKKENAEFVPYIGFVYDLTESTTAYASYTSIFQPQSSYGVDGVLAPIKGENIELGIKQELFDGRLTGSVAIFETNRDNVATRVAGLSTCGPTGTSSCYEGVDGIRTRGIEFEAAGELTDQWRLTGSYTYAQSEYTKGSQAGQKFSTDTYPEHILKLFTTYTFPGNRLTIGGGVRAQSKIYYRDSTLNIEQPTYAVGDLMAKYQFTGKTALQINVNNVFDKTYYTSINSDIGTGFRIGAPREFRISLKHEF